MKKTSEADLGEIVVKWLEKDGWDVYPEVIFGHTHNRADIIATRENVNWAIEIKKSFGLGVIAQAIKHYTIYRSVAVESFNKSQTHDLAIDICKDRGVGILEIAWDSVSELIAPKLIRSNHSLFKTYTKPYLHKEQKEYTPGSKHGYTTPYKRTMTGVRKYLKKYPGACLKSIIEKCGTHYIGSGATKSGMYQALTTFENDTIRYEKIKGKLRFHLK